VTSDEQWQALGRQVISGERDIQIVAEPAAAPTVGDSDRDVPGSAAVKENRRRRRTGPSLAHVWDVAQASGAALSARLGADADCAFPYVASWAGTDPRARPEAAVLAAGERIVAAAEDICGHLDAALRHARRRRKNCHQAAARNCRSNSPDH
jgi:hypothetical protein